jgi:hypothetical protein
MAEKGYRQEGLPSLTPDKWFPHGFPNQNRGMRAFSSVERRERQFAVVIVRAAQADNHVALCLGEQFLLPIRRSCDQRGWLSNRTGVVDLWILHQQRTFSFEANCRALRFDAKPFMIWAMIDGRRMTNAEIDAAFQEAIASRRARPGDKALAISWMRGRGAQS